MYLFQLWGSPGLGGEGVEGEHGLVDEDQLPLVELHQLDQLMHLVEHSPRLKAGVVERFLVGRADREFWKLPMEHHNTLL